MDLQKSFDHFLQKEELWVSQSQKIFPNCNQMGGGMTWFLTYTAYTYVIGFKHASHGAPVNINYTLNRIPLYDYI